MKEGNQDGIYRVHYTLDLTFAFVTAFLIIRSGQHLRALSEIERLSLVPFLTIGDPIFKVPSQASFNSKWGTRH